MSDDHHLGMQIHNPSDHEGRLKLRIASAELDLWIAPAGFVTLGNEQSLPVIIDNLGDQDLSVEWMKTRD
ncbi:MAG TPA: hypothetical protein VM536_02465 [Chloroflexia bacterium]|nr:hypothetical protein [Chloroflexia bacterium]